MTDFLTSTLGNNPFVQWIMAHWMLTLVIVLVVLLLIFLVIIPLISALIRKHKKVKETNDLKQDLQIWKNLSSLVQGGKEGREARMKLSTELKLITALFKMGIALIRKSKRKIYDMPWYVLVGEPKSGKSTLLENSDAGFLCSASENELSGDQTFPVRGWLGAKSFILDVSGKVFFDRWLEDSSAEWTHFVRLLTKYHSKTPLNGILLTIPADALMADSLQLVRQKLELIAAELQQLLICTGQKLSCQVIVTKMDMLPGFREFFRDTPAEIRNSVFGWENTDPHGLYSKKDVDGYFEQAHDLLNGAVGSKVLNPEFFRKPDSELRTDEAGKIYLFPENFISLREKLELYLDSLFGEVNWHGAGQLTLDGIFFTSSRDQGVTFSERFAELNGKKLNQCPIVGAEQAAPAFFTRQLFLEQILRIRPARFTSGKQFSLDFPTYLLCFLLLVISGNWIFSAMTKDFLLKYAFEPLTMFCQNLSHKLNVAVLDESPLIAYDTKKNEVVLLGDEPVKGLNGMTRMEFYYEIYGKAQEKIEIPVGFKIPAYLYDFLNQRASVNLRKEMYNNLQHLMVFLPLIQSFQQKVLHQKPEPFSLVKRGAMNAFLELSNRDYEELAPMTKAILVYVFPDF